MADQQADSIDAVRASAAYAAARQQLRDTDARTVADMREVTAIAAPSGAEAERGRWFAARLQALGLNAEVDDVGNVIAVTPATHPDAGQVVVAAHLDTVFAADIDLTLTDDGGRLSAPGISDNGRGLAGLLALARALHAAGWPTRAPVALVATVGEEGAGDLRGAKHLMEQRAHRTAAFIALDGAGASRVIHAGVGSRRLRVTWRVRGGHSWADWGAPNAVHAMGRAVAALAELKLPADPRTTLTVARAGGGTSINAIPAEAWVEMDLRSERRGALRELETRARDLLQRAAAEESRAGEQVSCDVVLIGDRPPGETPAHHPLVRIAEDATRALGIQPELTSSSTDANVAMSLDIPAIAIGAGGAAGGMHTTDEWYSNEDGVVGVERALLVVLACAGVGGSAA
jgi:tripeptide aminopeptidase